MKVKDIFCHSSHGLWPRLGQVLRGVRPYAGSMTGRLKTIGRIAAFVLYALALAPALALAQTAPIVVYAENFENGMGATTVAGLTSANQGTGGGQQNQAYSITGVTPVYQGASGTRYTAATDWLDGAHCDGIVLAQAATTQPSWVPSTTIGCNTSTGVQSFNGLRNIVLGIGTYLAANGASANYNNLTAAQRTQASNNHAVAAYTECNPANNCRSIGSGTGAGANGLMLRNTQPITITPGRFYTASVLVGMSFGTEACSGASSTQPQYQFSLNDGVNTLTVGTLDPCTAANRATEIVPNQQTGTLGTPATRTITVANLIGTPAILNGTSLTASMYSLNGATEGNDAAFDNMQVLDVTPSLSKSFSSSTITAGGTTTLTFTVTNRTDLAAKSGWSFTDNLPTGMTLASTTVGGTCRNPTNTSGTTATLTGAVGATSITLRGSLPAVASCTVTVTVQVASNTTLPTLQNCGSNMSSPQLIILPDADDCVEIKVTRPVTLTKIWQGATAGNAVRLTISGTDVSSATVGNSTAPSTTTNATAQAWFGSTVTLTEAFTSGSASAYLTTLNCVKATDGSTVTVTPAGLSGSFIMPTNSAVNCTFTNALPPNVVLTKKTTTPSPLAAGTQIDYTITLTNTQAGSTQPSGYTFTEVIPEHTTFVSVTGGNSQVTGCVGPVPPTPGSAAGTKCTITVNDPITVATPVQVTFTVKLDALLPAGTTKIVNQAYYDKTPNNCTLANNCNPTPACNTATCTPPTQCDSRDPACVETPTVTPVVSLTKTADVSEARAGGTITYTITASNQTLGTTVTGYTFYDVVPT
ncbi:MAG: DUF11 domain-containing protein, partial [Rhodanobacter sp.]|nr:DUF11 domain-containing protein [Rhodanobacter sp.]